MKLKKIILFLPLILLIAGGIFLIVEKRRKANGSGAGTGNGTGNGSGSGSGSDGPSRAPDVADVEPGVPVNSTPGIINATPKFVNGSK